MTMGQNRLREEGKLRQMAPKSFVLYCHSSNLYCSSFKLCCPPTEAMGNVGDYFDIECNTSDYRHDDGECALSVHINNNPEHLEPNNAYFEVTWEKDGEVTLMLGEDGDIEWSLTPSNLWSLMYCQAFCKPE